MPFTLSRLRSQFNSQLKFIKLVSAGKIKDSLKNFQFEKEIDKDGTITDVINANQSILVSCKRTNINQRPRISAELSGGFIVLGPSLIVFLFQKK
jgi:ribonuclease G